MKLPDHQMNKKKEYNIEYTLKNKKFGLFIIAYNAENHIKKTIERIPPSIRENISIYIIDDSSKDNTITVAQNTIQELNLKNAVVMKTPCNQGYGGNQKIGYTYAIKQGFDYAIMLHADGQYPPEFLHKIIEQFDDETVAAVFGSRMITKYEALKGGMPLYKWVGNQVLTKIENWIMKSNLSEFHSGYRAYNLHEIKKLPFLLNSNNFHFDTDIIIQLLANKMRIIEVPMPTHYGDEVCHVNGMKYFWNCLKSVITFRLHKIGIFYQPNFDIKTPEIRTYNLKNSPTSLHYHVVHKLPWNKNDDIIDLGANDGRLTKIISHHVNSATAVDWEKPNATDIVCLETDLNTNFKDTLGEKKYNKVIALDIIEHLYNPENAMAQINAIMKTGGKLYISTANISYFIMRLTHLIGWFDYGKKGILDKTHHRLYTINSFCRLLKNSGFTIEKIVGFGPPIADEISNKGILKYIDSFSNLLAKMWPSLFSFNFLCIAEKQTSFEDIYIATEMSKNKRNND